MKQTQKLLLFVAAAILLAANAHAGRWITRDPMEVQEHMERDPHPFLDLNPYTFVRNNPLSYFDPNGLNAVAFVDAQGNKSWWGPYDKTPPGYTFQLTPYNQELPSPGMFWGQDQYGNPMPMLDDRAGLQPSALGEMLLPTGAGLLAKPSWLTGIKVPCPRTPLWRAVQPNELADILKTGAFRNLGFAEGKYFSTTAEGAASYAKQAFYGLGDAPYTLVKTEVPNSLLGQFPISLVDRNVPAIVLPNSALPGLVPQVLSHSPIPR